MDTVFFKFQSKEYVVNELSVDLSQALQETHEHLAEFLSGAITGTPAFYYQQHQKGFDSKEIMANLLAEIDSGDPSWGPYKPLADDIAALRIAVSQLNPDKLLEARFGIKPYHPQLYGNGI
jgi:hypothetical protein